MPFPKNVPTARLLALIATLGLSLQSGFAQELRVASANADGLVAPEADGFEELKGSPAAPRTDAEFRAKLDSVGQYIARTSPGFVGVQDVDPAALAPLADATAAAAKFYLGNSIQVVPLHMPVHPGQPIQTLGALSTLDPDQWTAGTPYQLDNYATSVSYFIVPVTRTPNPNKILWMVVARFHGDERQIMSDLFAEIDRRAKQQTDQVIGTVVFLSGPGGDLGVPDLPDGWNHSFSPPFGTKYSAANPNETTDWILTGNNTRLHNEQVGGLALSLAQITPRSLHHISRHLVVYGQVSFE